MVLSVPTRRFNSGKREAAYGTKWTWLRPAQPWLVNLVDNAVLQQGRIKILFPIVNPAVLKV
jgi:hypothetical protein